MIVCVETLVKAYLITGSRQPPAASRLPFATQLGPGSNWDVAWDDRFVRPRRRGVGLTTVVVLCCVAHDP
jgi:hypothetical protein